MSEKKEEEKVPPLLSIVDEINTTCNNALAIYGRLYTLKPEDEDYIGTYR